MLAYGDPTHPPPPKLLADGPAPAYAVIYTSHHIPSHSQTHPPSIQIPPPPGGIYIFQKVRTNVRFAFKLTLFTRGGYAGET
jgi:hypothetical protein